MPEGDSPTVARRRVRLAIREAREAANLTQNQVAEEMEWSLSKVIRIENGDVTIAPNDLRPLLALLEIKEKSVVAGLLVDARIARTRQRKAWYQAQEYREHLTPALLRLIEYEAEAVAIRYYQIYFMPGPLQTPGYAKANLAKFDDDLSPEQQRFRAEARRLRRETVYSRLGSLKIYALLDESVFWRPLGGPEIFAAQLRELHELASKDLIKIRMVPFAVDAPLTNNATFDLLSLSADSDGSEVLYREVGFTDELVEDKSTTSRHHIRYDKIWHEAATEEDTISFIRSRIQELEKQTRHRRVPQ